jgi:two-component sensor histidine kinase
MLSSEGRLVAHSQRLLSPLAGYLLALLLFALAYAARAALDPILPPGFPFLTFFPAVIFATYRGGRGPGTLCAVLCGLAAWYAFVPPFHTFAVSAPTAWALGFYALITGTIIVIIDALQRTAMRLVDEREANRALVAEQRTLFQELQHRVANNMMFVAGLLALGRRTSAKQPEHAPAVLEEAEKRITMMSRIHRRLYDPSALDQPLERYITDLCHDLLEATGATNLVVAVDIDAPKLDLERLMALSLLLTELVTNSVKHGFAGRDEGTITLSLKRQGSDRLRLEVRDDGRGFEGTPTPSRGGGLGTLIAQNLAGQLGGVLEISGRRGVGTTTSLVFAA